MGKLVKKDSPILLGGGYDGSSLIDEIYLSGLIKLGYTNILVCNVAEKLLKNVKANYIRCDHLNNAFKKSPVVTILTNANAIYYGQGVDCVKAGSHLFVDKPLSSTVSLTDLISSMKKLGDFVLRNKREVVFGYIMRSNPYINKVRSLIEENAVGQIIYVKIQRGKYFPHWSFWEYDRKNSSSDKPDWGAEPFLTLSQEIDLLMWMFGKPQKFIDMQNHNANSKIAKKSAINILIQFDNCVHAYIHFDYMMSKPLRRYEFIGDKGRIIFDYHSNKIEMYSSGIRNTIRIRNNFDCNDMYIDRFKYFLDCLNKNIKPSPGIEEVLLSLEVPIKLKEEKEINRILKATKENIIQAKADFINLLIAHPYKKTLKSSTQPWATSVIKPLINTPDDSTIALLINIMFKPFSKEREYANLDYLREFNHFIFTYLQNVINENNNDIFTYYVNILFDSLVNLIDHIDNLSYIETYIRLEHYDDLWEKRKIFMLPSKLRYLEECKITPALYRKIKVQYEKTIYAKIKSNLTKQNELEVLNEIKMRLVDNLDKKYKLHQLQDIIFAVGAFCVYKHDLNSIRKLWTFKPSENSFVEGIVPNDISFLFEQFYADLEWIKNFPFREYLCNDVLYFRKYLILLIARSLVKNKFDNIDNFRFYKPKKVFLKNVKNDIPILLKIAKDFNNKEWDIFDYKNDEVFRKTIVFLEKIKQNLNTTAKVK